MEILKAELTDLPRIAVLAEKIWKEYYTTIISMEQINYMLERFYSKEAMEEQFREGQQFFLLKNEEDDIGYIGFSRTAPGAYFLHKFYIDLPYHRKGLGDYFLQNTLMLNTDIQTIHLQANRQNFRAINFYFKHGFTIEKVADFAIGNGYYMNDFVMVRKLQP